MLDNPVIIVKMIAHFNIGAFLASTEKLLRGAASSKPQYARLFNLIFRVVSAHRVIRSRPPNTCNLRRNLNASRAKPWFAAFRTATL